MTIGKESALIGYSTMVCWFSEGATYAIDSAAAWPRKLYKRMADTGTLSVVSCTQAECAALPGCPEALGGTGAKTQYAPHPLSALRLSEQVKISEPPKK